MNELTRTTAPSEAPPILDRLALLADPVRSRLLLVLEGGELTVTELTRVLQLPQSTVSRHLKALAQMEWVRARPDGTRRLYRAQPGGDGESELWRVVKAELERRPGTLQDRRRLKAVLAERPTRSQEFFSSAAGRWSQLRREMFGSRFELAGLPALLDRDWTVGDLGTGTGESAEVLAGWVRCVLAVDESEAMLNAARERLAGHENVELRQGRLEELPIADAELDAALLSLVLHHLAEPPEALREAARCLQPGGRLLVLDMLPHEQVEYRDRMGHRWLGFSEQQITEWLATAGFERSRFRPLPVDPQATGPALFAVAARKRAATPETT